MFASFLIDFQCLDVIDIKYFTVAYMALTLYVRTWRIWWAPNNARKGQMRFNSAFKGLILNIKKFFVIIINLLTCSGNSRLSYLYTLVYVILKHITLRSSNVLSMHFFYMWKKICPSCTSLSASQVTDFDDNIKVWISLLYTILNFSLRFLSLGCNCLSNTPIL
jgi:hypothetical protein